METENKTIQCMNVINKLDFAEKFLAELNQGLYDDHSALGLYDVLVMFQFIETDDLKLKKITREIIVKLNKKIDDKLNSQENMDEGYE